MSQFAKIFEAVKNKENKGDVFLSDDLVPSEQSAEKANSEKSSIVSKSAIFSKQIDNAGSGVHQIKTVNTEKESLRKRRAGRTTEKITDERIKSVTERYANGSVSGMIDSSADNLEIETESATASSDELQQNIRPIGKSRHPDYTQAMTYIKKDTHRAIKRLLIDDPQERNLSDLVEELLGNWINLTNKS